MTRNGRSHVANRAPLFPVDADRGIGSVFDLNEAAVVHAGDCRELLRQIPDESAQLVITSPPYNIGKEYESRVDLDDYVKRQIDVIGECVRILKPTGSICWETGNFVDKGEIVPLDVVLFPIFSGHGLKLRNRVIWHFEHGLHCSRRLSGRYETVLWFTKSSDYTFHLDPIRVAQKYPGKKYFKGPKAGQYSCNPLGKNPGDVWIIPNVKNNHVEKTDHPCQFPVELIERFVLSLTDPTDLVVDPYLGVGSSVVAAVLHGRRGAGAEVVPKYVRLAQERIRAALDGTLAIRPREKPVYDPSNSGSKLLTAPWLVAQLRDEQDLFSVPK